MTTPIIALFNNKGGVGKTSLAHHLSAMFAELGQRVLAADLDPQANLTSAFLDEDRLEELWSGEGPGQTIFSAVRPLKDGTGDIDKVHIEVVAEALGLIVGDLTLSTFEDELSQQWPKCLDRDPRAFRVITAFYRAIRDAAERHRASVVVVDVGPNLGAINRAALIAASHVVVPVAPDLFSLQGLRNLGPTVRTWRQEWVERAAKLPPRLSDMPIPPAGTAPVGYVVLQHAVRLDRPVKAYRKWVERIPEIYAQHVLEQPPRPGVSIESDPDCLGLIKHYRSLMPLAQEARKPIFQLTVADGAIGSHAAAARDVGRAFRELAETVSRKVGLAIPART